MPVYTLDNLYLIILFPLLGFLINGTFGRWLGRGFVHFVAISAVLLSAWQSTLTVWTLSRWGSQGDYWMGARLTQHLFTWFSVGNLTVDATLLVDPLTGVMLLVVTWISLLIHIYSMGYMAHEEGYARYFAYLNLFVASMLILVMGQSLVVMFVGWEGVGLCSYLLIGFWFTDAAKAAAGLKAFVVNRIGDFGFLLGMFALFMLFGTLDTVALEARVAGLISLDVPLAPGVPLGGLTIGFAITLAVLGLFVGATGKSAQIPLYVWLPDAMAGPTPVSALIHAATMVTAGVYMLSRLNYLVVLSPTAMTVIAVVGAATALVAATIGFAQTDIKKVLAYSTVSQLGYMFLGAGVGAFVASIFHLITHAFFKACLFLGAGSVIHGMGGEQDIRKMGGLTPSMPRTRDTFLMAVLAIMGFPLTAGFMSKDEILWWSFASPRGHTALWLVGLVGAGCTSFYMWRLYYMTFAGDGRRLERDTRHHVHESPWTMVAPLYVLGMLSLVGGLMGVPAILGEPVAHLLGARGNVYSGNFLLNWLEPVYAVAARNPLSSGLFNGPGELAVRLTHLDVHAAEWTTMGMSVATALFAWWLATRLYRPEPSAWLNRIPRTAVLAQLHRGALAKWWVDEFYQAVLVRPLRVLSGFLYRVVDIILVDGLLTVVPPALIKITGSLAARLHNGDMQRYVAFIILGACVMLAFLVR